MLPVLSLGLYGALRLWHLLRCQGLQLGAEVGLSRSDPAGDSSGCVCEDKFVGETQVLGFFVCGMDCLGTGLSPAVTEHSKGLFHLTKAPKLMKTYQHCDDETKVVTAFLSI